MLLAFHLAILLPFISAIFILLFLKNTSRFHIGWFVLPIPISLFAFLLTKAFRVSNSETFSYELPWIPSFQIYFTTFVDGLSMLFGLLITGIGTLVVLYSIYYLSTEQALKHFYIYLLLFMGSMLGVVFSDHLIMLYVFWELTSISSFLLIAFWFQRRGSRYGAKKSLLITVFGGFSMLMGFLMLHHVTGTFSIQEIINQAEIVKNSSLLVPIIILILLGAFSKSVQFPFHIWLPDAMEAPTPISAYLHSATMVKAGIYLVARTTPIFGGEMLWFYFVSSIGIFTLLWGALIAIRQTDLKALLAYSTISQLGLIMSLFGVGSLSLHPEINVSTILMTQAAYAALFHLLNHATFKGALFMIVGIIDFQIGTRDLRRLGGLIALMPISFTVALIGSFSMAGLPPFNGFLSKEMFFTAMLHLKEFDLFSTSFLTTLFPVIAWIASIFTFIYSMMIVFQTFFGKKQDDYEADLSDPPFGMLISPIVLSCFVVFIFFFPNKVSNFILKPAIQSVYPAVSRQDIPDLHIWHGFNTELFMTLGIVVIGALLFKYRNYFKKIFILLPQSFSLDHLYNSSIHAADSIAKTITNFYMTRYLRDYFSYIFIFIFVLLGGAIFYFGDIDITAVGDQSINLFEWALSIMIVIAAISILFLQSRLSVIVVNGFIGFAIAMLFVLFRAPDLALTQLVVETVTTALFLLAFYFLPEWERRAPKINWRNLLIALSVGVTFTLIALMVNSSRLFPSISEYFERADELAEANNIVNTILGDFRAFDTMLEVIVLFIAGIGVYSLIKYKNEKGANKVED